MRLRIAAVLLGLASAAAHGQITVSPVDTNSTLVFATGQARQSVIPDRATLIILIDAQAMSADEAAARLTTIERAVLDTLRRFNLGATQAYNAGIVPFRQQGMPAGVSGPTFSGRSTIRVEVTRLDQLNALTSAVLAKGATFIAAPTFTTSNADSVRRALLPRALEQAQRDAEALARAAGGHLGRLIDVNVQGVPFMNEPPSSIMFTGSTYYDNGARATPNTMVTANVTARWLLVRTP